MPDKPILIVHPNDKTTSFLDKIKTHLIKKFGEQIHHFNIYPNEKSHSDCLERIRSHPTNGFIIFLGHGRTDKLYGSKGEMFDNANFVSEAAKDDNPDAYFYNDDYINEGNIQVFSGKKVFCLACNSNNKIANAAIANGAKTFLGFGNIPTSLNEFLYREEQVTNEVVIRMKTEINYIIKTSLALSISNDYSFEGLLNHIQFITNQRLTDIVANQKNFKERHVFADYLYHLKNDAKLLGDKRIKLIE